MPCFPSPRFGAILVVLCFVAAGLRAAEPRAFDLPADTAERALRAFSKEAGVPVVFPSEIAQDVRTPAVRGRFTVREALDRLLAGTGLTATQDVQSGGFLVQRGAPAPNGPRAAAAPTTPARPEAKIPGADETLVLSPFTVQSAKDNGYAAAQSLSGSRLATELKFIPAPVSVLTREFLEDLAVADVQEAMQWTVNSNASTGSDANSGNFANGQSILAQNNTDIRVRGGLLLSSARNFFKWSVNSDIFNTERLDISRGPNALLFGDSSLAGMVNVSTKRAGFKAEDSVHLQASSYGGGRVALDANHPLLRDRLAVRVNAYVQRTDDWRDFGKTDRKGVALATTWRPLRSLEVRTEAEWGRRNDFFVPTYLRSGITGWNHQTVFDTPGALTAAQAAAAGLRRFGANTFVLNNARPGDGVVDWSGMGDTVVAPGTIESPIATRLWGGSTLAPVAITERAVLSPTPVRRDFVVPSFAFSMLNAGTNVDSEHRTVSLFAEQRVGRNLFLELAGNIQDEDRRQYTRVGDNNRVSYDVNRLLPAGTTINGSATNPNFLAPYIQSVPRIFNTYTRVAEVRGTAAYQVATAWFRQSLGVVGSYRRTDGGQARSQLVRTNGDANLSSLANEINFRTYLDRRDASTFVYRDGATYNVGSSTIAFANNSGVSAGQTHADSIIRSVQAFVVGSWFKGDRLHTVLGLRRDNFYSKQFNTHVFDPVTRRYLRSNLSDILRATIDSPSLGAVLGVTRWLSLYGNTSKSYNPPTQSVLNYQGRPIEAPTGKTAEAGVKFSFLGDRLGGSLGVYRSEQKNNTSRSNPLNNAYDAINGALGLPTGSAPFDSNTQEAKGTEFELVANPTPAWTLTANVAFPHTSNRDTLPSFRQFYAANEPGWRAIANNPADPRSTVLRTQLAVIDAQLATASLGEGIESTRNRELTANLLTRYRFAAGRLKGLAVGGGFNYLGDQKIGRNAAAGQDIMTEAFYLVTGFVRYQGVWRTHRWSAQVNASNLLDTEKFRYTSLGANNVPDAYRVASPRELRFTATFAF